MATHEWQGENTTTGLLVQVQFRKSEAVEELSSMLKNLDADIHLDQTACQFFIVSEQVKDDLLIKLNELLDKQLAPVFVDPRPGDVKHSRASIEKAREMLNYEPIVDFDEGLARTLDWYKTIATV